MAIDELRRTTPSLRELTEELRERLRIARQGGDERSRLRHTDRGKMLVRDRVDRLVDPGSPLLELAPLAGYGMYSTDDGQDAIPSAGMVTAVGRVAGRECVIVANDATVKGGTYYPITVKKHLRAQSVALGQSTAVPVSGGFRRRIPPPAG